MIIIVKSIFGILFPETQLREHINAFFSRRAEVLAVMGGNISQDGIASLVSDAVSMLYDN